MRGRLFIALSFAVWIGTAASQRAHALTPDELKGRLKAEREALSLLGDQRVAMLDVLEVVEGLNRSAELRLKGLDRRLEALEMRAARAERSERRWKQARDVQAKSVAPRLRALYRLRRSQSLDQLLDSKSLAEVVRTAQSLNFVVRRDVESLESLQKLERLHARGEQRLARLRASIARERIAVEEERALATARRAELSLALSELTAKVAGQQRLLAELQQAESQVAELTSELEPRALQTGFTARKGKLPFPVTGLLEVGFGRVVNPKFNTVTVQKGLDIRARMGTDVRAVADGTVVFAGWMRGYGNLLILDHGQGYHSLMAHLSQFERAVGDAVNVGEVVGAVGDSASLKGPYLYFELRRGGQAIDPAPWLSETDPSRL